MKKLATILVAAATCALLAGSAFAANSVRISQVYGGGGGGSGTYIYDYVELFNASGAAIDISGWSLAYGSATGTWGTSSSHAVFTFPAGSSIGSCKYVLVQCGTAGSGGGAFPVTPDYSNTAINMSASTGKIGLFTAVNDNVACGSELGVIIDKVAYGSTATCSETAPAGGTSATSGAVRAGAGMTDTDSNAADFAIVSNPVPRNSASPANANCQAVPTIKSTWGQLKSIYR
jgi:hypothetical protein